MKFEVLDPLDILPIEPPHKPETVRVLCDIYSTQPAENLPYIIPPVLVRRLRSGGLHPLNGHHRIGMAYIFQNEVPAIFINNFNDIADVYALQDMGIIFRPDEITIDRNQMLDVSRELRYFRQRCVNSYGVETFVQFSEMLQNGLYVNLDVLSRNFGEVYNGFAVEKDKIIKQRGTTPVFPGFDSGRLELTL